MRRDSTPGPDKESAARQTVCQTMAIASRTYEPAWAKRLLDLFEIRDYFDYEEIYPSAKDRHFKALKKHTGLPYDQMVFFDDEKRNIQEVSQLGVTSVHVRDGVTWDVFLGAMGSSFA